MVAGIDYGIRDLEMTDIEQAMQLNIAAGWNQTPADWKMILSCKGYHLAAIVKDQIVATIASLDYDQFVWIAMVLVDPSFRRKGIATTLLNKVMAHYSDRVLRLDGTEAGAAVYAHLGFREECYLHRWVLKKSTSLTIIDQDDKTSTVPDLDQLLSKDQAIFGGDRSPILESMSKLNDPRTLSAAYLFSRVGHRAQQIGPLVASDISTARTLVESCITRSQSSQFYLDTFEHQEWEEVLLQLGFKRDRKFVRMQKGTVTDVGKVKFQYAIGGPEIG